MLCGGFAKPSVYAPIYGGAGSNRNTPFSFAVRLIVRAGDALRTYRRVRALLVVAVAIAAGAAVEEGTAGEEDGAAASGARCQ